jgi:Na+-transporting methylmalonyl-CoA/oxaloacetate decarboxylase gamma subunit
MFAFFGTETPMPMPSMTVEPDSVTPGFIGFAAVVIVVIAVILLIWDMNRRVRRVRYREEVRQELDAEEAAAREAEAQSPEDDDRAR